MSLASLTGGRSKDQGRVPGAAGVKGPAEWERAEPSQAELWHKIKAFELDRPGDSFPLSARLARENGWSRPHALRVIEEYRRFVYLMATSPHPVTPSEAVDQAWHLHMTYTRSYWEGLCRSVIGRDLHHDPTRGGGDETAKFTDWYARTLDGYRRVFGTPPEDIWPSAGRRFEPTRMQWVDLAAFRLVPRKRPTRRWAWLGVAAGGLGAIGCGSATGPGAADGLGTVLCLFAAVVGVLILISAALVSANAKNAATPSRRGSRHTGSSGEWAGPMFTHTPGVFDNSDSPHGHGHGGHHGHGDGSGGHGHGCGHGHGSDGGHDGGGHGCSGGDGGSSGCSGGDGGGGCGGGGDGGGGGCGGGGCGGGGD